MRTPAKKKSEQRAIKKKTKQLGMAPGTAQAKLRKSLLFYLAQKCGLDVCFHCNKQIESVDELSIEHMTPWLDSDDPKALFFDLDNIAFAHLRCNIGAARKSNRKLCPSVAAYRRGCRCEKCLELGRRYSRQNWHRKGKQTREQRLLNRA